MTATTGKPGMSEKRLAQLRRYAAGGSLGRCEAEELLAEVKRLHEIENDHSELDRHAAYLREQNEQLAQIATEHATQATALRAQLDAIGKTREAVQLRACQSPDGPLNEWTDVSPGNSVMITPWPGSAGRIRVDFRTAPPVEQEANGG